MGKFIISGFADEIAPELDKQMTVLKKLGIGFAELRGIDGKNVSDYTAEEMKTVKERLDKGGIRVSSIGSPIGKIGIDDDFDAHLKRKISVFSAFTFRTANRRRSTATRCCAAWRK